ncbi:RNA-guided endonuclease InsQ/TnpB family protein [Lederbergia lenta]|uniref:Transposase n=1 Tax=Lederbergia lenta TaxID=1467 RepID=A0A2X4X164_LEDLE|nr:RNA-guided endonuclease TnpB family protein [Lederbergia lenta]MEC2326216.1 transposase [Lederbergia lenta]SQI63700.1 transposase [Lederbergia lenta]
MSQTITVQIKILPTKDQASILERMSKTYIQTINTLVSEMITEKKSTMKSSKDIHALLPSAVKNQAIRDAKSVYKKAEKNKYKNVPVLKRPVCVWNNQNYCFNNTHISMPIMVNGKASKTPIRALVVDKDHRTLELLKHKLGTLRITKKANKWIAQISVTISTVQDIGTKVMGVDLGLKVPAVAVTDDEKVCFFGNGRKNKYMRKKFLSKRKELGKKKKLNAIKRLKDKERRWMRDQDHKISRSIVNFAKENKISVIHLERLANIRQTTGTSRKNEKNLHTWTLYRLSQFIEYKAKLEGIKVEYVNPAYTSQTCPKCAKRNTAQDRKYKCKCGFEKHRDFVGAMNIRYAPVVDGKS